MSIDPPVCLLKFLVVSEGTHFKLSLRLNKHGTYIGRWGLRMYPLEYYVVEWKWL